MARVLIITNPRDTASCDSCGWAGPGDDLEPISDFEERVAPGEPCPAGECPKCGGLCRITMKASIRDLNRTRGARD